MKLRLLFPALLLGSGLVYAATYRPSNIVYGVIRDSYGLRLSPESALVSAFFGTNEVARTSIRQLPLGSNYRFDVNVADPLTGGTNNIVPGSPVAVRVRVGNVLQPTIGTNIFQAKGDGAVFNINLVLGIDSDNDGIPDDWEWLAIANSGGAINNLAQIGIGTDLDGDGLTDDKEFLSGTFPFLPDDQLRISAMTVHNNGRLSFAFTPIEGQSYWVEFKPTLDAPEWNIAPISTSEIGTLVPGTVTGGTQKITVYMEPGNPTRFWRLRVKQ